MSIISQSLFRPVLNIQRSVRRAKSSIRGDLASLLLAMPKEEKHLDGLRRTRKDKRMKYSNEVSDNVYFQVVGNGAPGGVRSLVLITSHNRHLFNCSEGSQRIVTEQCPPRSLGQLANIFITSKKWDCLGGFPGMALSIRGAGSPDVSIYGPKGCVTLFEATKNFVLLYEFDVIPRDFGDGPYKDSNIMVEQIQLAYSGPPVLPLPPTYTPWDGLVSMGVDGKGKSIFKEKAEHSIVHSAIDQSVLSFLISIKGKKGKLDADKCLHLGVPPGPLLGLLKRGESVKLENGTVVESKDVTSADSPEIKCLVMDCPSAHYLPSLVENDLLNGKDQKDQNFAYVFHFTPSSVMETPEYKKWMGNFSKTATKHILLNDSNSGLTTTSTLIYTKKLQMIAPELFPTLSGPLTPVEETGNVVQARGALVAELKPETKLDMSKMEFFDEKKAEAEVLEDGKKFGLKDSIRCAHEKMGAPDLSQPLYPKVTFLGTGSSIPSKYRNVTSILVEHKPDSYIILDCGEGSVGQLHRHFGREKALGVLRNTKCVFISHHHADHHLGLIDIVQTRTKAFEAAQETVEKLYVICPGKMGDFYLQYHNEFEPFLADAYQIRNEHLLLATAKGTDTKSQILFPWVMKEMLEYIGLKNIITCRALHCPHAYCVTFTTEADYKVVFTGDTRPTDNLIEIARHLRTPDLVIHEATMEHKYLKDAIVKKHSTFTEAIENSKAMGTKFTLLTHFSQRYSKLPLLQEIEGKKNVGIAFDNLSVTPQTMGMLQHIYEPLKIMFRDELQTCKDKTEQLMRRQKGNAVMNELGMRSSPPKKKARFSHLMAE
jgi:ribonuclease Z